MSAIVRLEWTRYPDGFELTDDPKRYAPATAPGWYLAPRKPKRSERYVIEGTAQRVSIDLANVKDDDASVLAFVDKWGLLQRGHAQSEAGRKSPSLLANLMRGAITDMQRNPDGEGNHRWLLQPTLWLRRARLAGDSAPRVFLQPEDLFVFCCVEALLLIEATEIRKCLRCGDLFALGKVGKPPMYCRPACKKAMYRKHRRAAEQRASNMASLRRSAGR